MLRLTIIAVSIGICALADAQTLTVGEIKTKGAVQLSSEDLKQLLPGAKVMSKLPDGTTRRWENKPNGTLVASSDAAGMGGGRAYRVQGSGTWKIDDNGRFCVAIQWNTKSEDVCRFILKADGKYYGAFKLDASTAASEFEFSK